MATFAQVTEIRLWLRLLWIQHWKAFHSLCTSNNISGSEGRSGRKYCSPLLTHLNLTLKTHASRHFGVDRIIWVRTQARLVWFSFGFGGRACGYSVVSLRSWCVQWLHELLAATQSANICETKFFKVSGRMVKGKLRKRILRHVSLLIGVMTSVSR